MIAVRNLHKQYGDRNVVADVSFDVAAGETLVLLGTSGCGKTTTLKMLNRLIEPTGGTIRINGQDVVTQPPHALRRQIGYVIQETGLFPHYTVAQNVAVVPRLLGWDDARIRQRSDELLELLHLPVQLRHRYPAQLSGGQRQRVGLARALAADPPVILMDEPFGALDPVTRAGIRREFARLDALRRKTIVLVTHDVAEAFELADRIALMHEGRIQQLDTPRNLLRQPATGFVRQFLAEQRPQLELLTTTLADVQPYLSPATTLPDSATTLAALLTDLPDTPTGRALRGQLLTALGHYVSAQTA